MLYPLLGCGRGDASKVETGSVSRIIGAISAWEPFRSWDALAMGLSGLCLAHCVLTSIMFGLMASVGGLLAAPEFHEIGLALAIAMAVIAFYRGLQEHGMTLPSWIGGAGLLAMAAALMAPHGGPETALTIFGVLLLGYGHWLNRRATA